MRVMTMDENIGIYHKPDAIYGTIFPLIIVDKSAICSYYRDFSVK